MNDIKKQLFLNKLITNNDDVVKLNAAKFIEL